MTDAVSTSPPAPPPFALHGLDVERARIETAMLAAVDTSDAYLNELASHLIHAGGKRLRPVLAVVAGRLAGTRYESVSHDVVRGGVACELVHLGSLYHDDVMDEAETRRGVETVNARWGNLQAIVAGDFLLARASEIAASLGTEVAGLLAATIGRLCEGQIEELKWTYDADRSEASYLSSIEGKTASLYAASCRIGAIVAGLDRTSIDAITNYGLAYGMVFQIVDDVLDLTATSASLGKPAGHDLEAGVYTLPVLRALRADTASAAELRSLLGGPLSPAELNRALTIVREGDAVADALTVAREYAEQTQRACDVLVERQPGSDSGDDAGPADNPQVAEAIGVLRQAPFDLLDGL